MKKLFDKLVNDKPGAPGQSANLLGKIVQIGAHSVRVEKVLGEGGLATVYKATDSNGTTFALKHLRLANAEAAQDMADEARTLAKLKGHPHILRLYATAFAGPEGAETDGFMLLEYCPSTLLDLMQKHSFQLDELTVFTIFSEVCKAVAHMHAQNPPLAHRDLKAENVLRSAGGHWVLADFGSATSRAQVYHTTAEIAEEEENVRRNTTPAYRAPEMWDLYSRHRIDTKVDVWSLGVLLYVLMNGKLPWPPGDPKLAILNGRVTFPASSRHSEPMRTLVTSLLVADPAQRPDMRTVMGMLESIKGAFTLALTGGAMPQGPQAAGAMTQGQTVGILQRAQGQSPGPAINFVQQGQLVGAAQPGQGGASPLGQPPSVPPVDVIGAANAAMATATQLIAQPAAAARPVPAPVPAPAPAPAPASVPAPASDLLDADVGTSQPLISVRQPRLGQGQPPMQGSPPALGTMAVPGGTATFEPDWGGQPRWGQQPDWGDQPAFPAQQQQRDTQAGAVTTPPAAVAPLAAHTLQRASPGAAAAAVAVAAAPVTPAALAPAAVATHVVAAIPASSLTAQPPTPPQAAAGRPPMQSSQPGPHEQLAPSAASSAPAAAASTAPLLSDLPARPPQTASAAKWEAGAGAFLGRASPTAPGAAASKVLGKVTSGLHRMSASAGGATATTTVTDAAGALQVGSGSHGGVVSAFAKADDNKPSQGRGLGLGVLVPGDLAMAAAPLIPRGTTRSSGGGGEDGRSDGLNEVATEARDMDGGAEVHGDGKGDGGADGDGDGDRSVSASSSTTGDGSSRGSSTAGDPNRAMDLVSMSLAQPLLADVGAAPESPAGCSDADTLSNAVAAGGGSAEPRLRSLAAAGLSDDPDQRSSEPARAWGNQDDVAARPQDGEAASPAVQASRALAATITHAGLTTAVAVPPAGQPAAHTPSATELHDIRRLLGSLQAEQQLLAGRVKDLEAVVEAQQRTIAALQGSRRQER